MGDKHQKKIWQKRQGSKRPNKKFYDSMGANKSIGI